MDASEPAVNESKSGLTPVRALARGLAVLEMVAASPGGVGVSDAARGARLDKATTARLLATLRDCGFVRQRAGDRRYVLTGRMLNFARRYEEQLDLRSLARPYLEQLRDECHETVHLAIREGRHVIYADHLEPDRSVRASAETSRLPLHVAATGRAILAALPDAESHELLLQLASEPPYADLLLDVDKVGKELVQARREGWATVDRDDDVSRIGVAIIDAAGRPIAAISVSGPRYRMDEHRALCADAARRTAHEIGKELGA